MISVVIATYNGEKYIEEQLDSILTQSVVPDEIIICDDNSTDATVVVINNVLSNANIRYKIIRHEKNLGVTKSFEDALRESHGEIIFFCDQDDYWKSQKIELTLSLFNNPKVVLAFCNASIVDDQLNETGQTLWEKINFIPTKGKDFNSEYVLDNNWAFEELCKRNYITGMCLAIRRSILNEFSGFSKYMLHDEYLSWLSIFCGEIAILPQTEVLYRQHKGNVIGIRGIKSERNVRKIRQMIERSSGKTFNKFSDIYKTLPCTDYENGIKEAIGFYRWRAQIYRHGLFYNLTNLIYYLHQGFYSKYSSQTEKSRTKDLFLVLTNFVKI